MTPYALSVPRLSQALRQRAGLTQLQPVRQQLVARFSTSVDVDYVPHKELASIVQGASEKQRKQLFASRRTADLVRAAVVLRLCGSPLIVHHSERMIDLSKRILGQDLTHKIIQASFYSHFCAGDSATDVWMHMNKLRAMGVRAIVDYAEEEDLLGLTSPSADARQAAVDKAAQAASSSGHTPRPQLTSLTSSASSITSAAPLGAESVVQSGVMARMYLPTGEDDCDRHLAAFMAAIDVAGNLPGQGFAAIKLTALTSPLLLERLSAFITQVQAAFDKLDANGDGLVSRSEFQQGYSSVASMDHVDDDLFQALDTQQKGVVDIHAWMGKMDFSVVPQLARAVRLWSGAPPAGGAEEADALALSPDEQALLDRLNARVEALVQRAISKDVKLMIDAEHSLFNPAVNYLGSTLMRTHNRGGRAVVFTTYQAYLRSCLPRLQQDLAAARQDGYVLGAKLVRGAYYHLERKRAAELGVSAPVYDHLSETTQCFDACVDLLLGAAKERKAEMMVGTHNATSAASVAARMAACGMDPDDEAVFFGQLMGMSDVLSLSLGQQGYQVYKYVPYGQVSKVLPYLLRRANEVQYGARGGRVQDLQLVQQELWDRARAALHL